MIVIDMDMPQSCEKCGFFDGEDMCCIDGTYALNPSRISVCPSWCPIKCDIKDIKAEISELSDHEWIDARTQRIHTWEGMKKKVLEIIDKHIKVISE